MANAESLAWGDWFTPHVHELAQAVLLTVAIGVIAMAGSVVLGLLGGLVAALRVPVARHVITAFVEVVRNTPLIVQITFMYIALPSIGITLSPFTIGCVSLTIWGGAYNVENFRAGFEGVRGAYARAGRALGFGVAATFRYVVLPLGVRMAFPSVRNTLVNVLKNTSLLIGIGLAVLSTVVVNLVEVTFRVFEWFFVLGLSYLTLVLILSLTTGMLESRLARRGAL